MLGTSEATAEIADNELLSVSIEQATSQNDPTTASSAVFTVGFNSPITPATLETTDFDTSSSTAAGVTVDSVSEVTPNDGTTFEVTLSATGDGDIIVSLPANSVDAPSSLQNEASTSVDNSVTIDTTPPPTPTTPPNLIDAEDTGSSNTDNVTSVTNPAIEISCTDPSTVTLYVNNTASGTGVCSGGTVSITPTSPLSPDGTFAITYTETDESGNESGQSPQLSIEVDTTSPTPPPVDFPTPGGFTDGTIASGTGATPGDIITAIVQGSGETCTAIVQADGSWSCDLSPVPSDGPITLEVTATDPAGNESTPTVVNATVDTTPPGAPIVNQPTPNSTVVIPTVSVEVVCNEPGEVIMIESSNINPNPTSETCSAAGPKVVSVEVAETGLTTLSVTLTDEAGNQSQPTTVGFIAVTADDTDGDGVPNVEENTAPNGDGNGDGIQDAEQADVASVSNPVTGAHTTLVASNGCTIIDGFVVVAESSLAVPDDEYDYPVGLNDFQVDCNIAGAMVDIAVYYDQIYDTSDWLYRKFNQNTNTYGDISSLVTYAQENVNGTDVTVARFSITDGGPLDEDGVADGKIFDPSGAAVGAEGLSETGAATIYTIVLGATVVTAAIAARSASRTLNSRQDS